MINPETEALFIQSLHDQFYAVNQKLDALSLDNILDDEDTFDTMIFEADQLVKHLSKLQSPQAQKAFIPSLEETLQKLEALEYAYNEEKETIGHEIIAINQSKMADMAHVLQNRI